MAAGANRRVRGVARLPCASPSAHLVGANGKRETYVVDHRPSDLDPYPRLGRDLATLELWEQSSARSRQRRRLEQASRSHRQRRKGTSLAVGAAMLAAPVMPAFARGLSRGSGTSGGRSGAPDPGLDLSSLAAATGGRTPLPRFGDVGPAVVAIQRQVGVTPDGMFGPITRAAVERFQRVHGLGVSGIVDARTWAALFNGRVLFYDESGGRGAAPSAPSRASLRLVVDRDSDGAGSSTASPEGTGRVARADGPGGSSGSGSSGSASGSSEASGSGASGASRSSGSASSGAGASGSASSGAGSSGPGLSGSGPAPAREPAPSVSPAPPAPTTGPAAGGCTSGRIGAPVNGTVTGHFGDARSGHAHAGEDIAAPTGTPIHAAQCGTVVQAGSEQGYGLMVCIRHAGGVTTCYAHMSRIGASVNQQVQAGQVIGYVGCTGNCTGPHVHFEVRRNGTAVDPAPYLAGKQTIAGTTSTAASTHATSVSVKRTSTASAGASSGASTHTTARAAVSTGGTSAAATAAAPQPAAAAAAQPAAAPAAQPVAAPQAAPAGPAPAPPAAP